MFKVLVAIAVVLTSPVLAKSAAFFFIGAGPKIYTLNWDRGELELVEFSEDDLDEIDFSNSRPANFSEIAERFNRGYLEGQGIGTRVFHDLVPLNGPQSGFHIITRPTLGGMPRAQDVVFGESEFASHEGTARRDGIDHLNLLRYVQGPTGFPGMVVMDRDYELGYQAIGGSREFLLADIHLNFRSVSLMYLSSGMTLGNPDRRLVMAYVFGQMADQSVGISAGIYRLEPQIPQEVKRRPPPSSRGRRGAARLPPSQRRSKTNFSTTGSTLYFETFEMPDAFEPQPGYPMFHSSDSGAKELLQLFFNASRGACSSNIVVLGSLRLER